MKIREGIMVYRTVGEIPDVEEIDITVSENADWCDSFLATHGQCFGCYRHSGMTPIIRLITDAIGDLFT